MAAGASKAPATADLAKGDPGGTITGTISDVPAADSKVGVTLTDIANQVGQNKIAVNFMWTLVTGFLVMFMQAGFAMVESGLCRVKNANHTYMMNFFVYTAGSSPTGSWGSPYKWAARPATETWEGCSHSPASTP